jgi:hypothetical protein
MVVSTPNPFAFKALVVFSMASSKVQSMVTVKWYVMPAPIIDGFFSIALKMALPRGPFKFCLSVILLNY